MTLRIDDFEIDEFNEAEMARHGVKPREAYEVLRGQHKIHKNKKEHATGQPYIMRGLTVGGRLLDIPIKPLDPPGLWRPATAYDAG